MGSALTDLGRRERQIMDIVFRLGAPLRPKYSPTCRTRRAYSSVRSMLRLLEEKGYLGHEWDGPRHVYRPTAHPDQIRRSALRHLLRRSSATRWNRQWPRCWEPPIGRPQNKN